MTAAYLVLECLDEHQVAITPASARLVNEQSQAALDFVDDPSRGLHIDLSASPLGPARLEITLPNHPTLPFRVEIEPGQFAFVGPTPKCCTVARTNGIAGDSSSPRVFTATFELRRAHEEIIFVAGWDYLGKANFSAWCDAWRDDLYEGRTWISGKARTLPRKIHDHTIVTHFDFATGLRVRRIKGQKGWHELDRALQGQVPTDRRYPAKDPDNKHKRHADDSISILHVYEHIKQLGRAQPGSLLGLHVFSHSWSGGPIMVNTNQRPIYASGGAWAHRRDPGDKDCRSKDFNGHNMPDVADFRAAFRPDASVKVWGCFATTFFRRLVRAAANAGADKTKPLKIRKDAKTFVEMSAAEIEAYIRDTVIGRCFMTRMAKAARIPVYGAPPGTGSNQARIRGRYYSFVNQRVFKKEFRWYANALGLAADESGYIPYR